jgi:two-component system, NtrC family, nitrogen regulation sensor histidine kinase NtrY
MVYNRIFWNVVLRVALITLNVFGLCILLINFDLEDLFTIVLVFILLFSQIILFIRSQTRISRDLTNFFEAAHSLDSNLLIKKSGYQRQYPELYSNILKLNSIIAELKLDLEEQAQFYRTTINRAPVSIISFSEEGRIGLINDSAKKLLGIADLYNLNDLKSEYPDFIDFILSSPPGKTQVLKTMLSKELMSLLIKRDTLTIMGNSLNIVSLQNIESELVKKEIDSWHDLLQTLTHEIANTIAPISSTIETLQSIIQKDNAKPESGNTKKDLLHSKLVSGLRIIGDRNKGLLSLVGDIQKFTSFPIPRKKTAELGQFFFAIGELFRVMPGAQDIKLQIQLNESHEKAVFDDNQITQVLLNLFKNSIEAMEGETDKMISVVAGNTGLGNFYISLEDNGPGISSDLISKVFIPFFTSKKNGSGIGLSLSQEIMYSTPLYSTTGVDY